MRRGSLVSNLLLAGGLVAAFVTIDRLGKRRDEQEHPLAPAFELPLITKGGGTARLEAYRGKAVVVNFWASWCGVCKDERNDLAAFAKRSTGTFLGIATSDRPSEAKAEESAHPHGYPVAVDADGIVADLYSVRSLPQTFVIGPDGRILRHFRQALSVMDLSEIKMLLEGKVATASVPGATL